MLIWKAKGMAQKKNKMEIPVALYKGRVPSTSLQNHFSAL
jgi:hypothetical protein